MQPGLWVMTNGNFAAVTAAWGVTPTMPRKQVIRAAGLQQGPRNQACRRRECRWRRGRPDRSAHRAPWETAQNAGGFYRVGRRQRPHRYNQWSVKSTRRPAGDVRAEHRHIAFQFDVADGDPGLQQRVLEGERATDQEADQVVAQKFLEVGRLIDQFAVLPYPITRQIGTQIGAARDCLRLRIARLGDVEDWARFGVALAKEEKVEGQFFRHDN